MPLTWEQICEGRPLEMRGTLAFMERRRPGSTRDVQAATPEQIAALVEPLAGGVKALPRVYLEFLEAMGEHAGPLTLERGFTPASALLVERSEPERSRADSNRYFKFSIGEDHYNGRRPDDFFDLSRLRPDHSDGAIIRVRESDLVRGRAPREPYACFSDLMRAVTSSEFGLDDEPAEPPIAFSIGDDAGAPARAFEFLTGLGFELTELGASSSRIVLEDRRRGVLAMVKGPTPRSQGTLLRVRVPAGKSGLHLVEVLKAYEERALGTA